MISIPKIITLGYTVHNCQISNYCMALQVAIQKLTKMILYDWPLLLAQKVDVWQANHKYMKLQLYSQSTCHYHYHLWSCWLTYSQLTYFTNSSVIQQYNIIGHLNLVVFTKERIMNCADFPTVLSNGESCWQRINGDTNYCKQMNSKDCMQCMILLMEDTSFLWFLLQGW